MGLLSAGAIASSIHPQTHKGHKLKYMHYNPAKVSSVIKSTARSITKPLVRIMLFFSFSFTCSKHTRSLAWEREFLQRIGRRVSFHYIKLPVLSGITWQVRCARRLPRATTCEVKWSIRYKGNTFISRYAHYICTRYAHRFRVVSTHVFCIIQWHIVG